MLAVLCMSAGINAAWAAEQEVAVKMTFVDGTAGNNAVAGGEVTTATTGYNKISEGSVVLGNAGWGANNVIYLQVDASAIASDITKVTLSLEASGSTDSKRTAGIGVGYNASAWSADLTWDTADRSITILGDQVWTATKSATVFEQMSFDITEAFSNDADKVVTILVYNTQAAGNNIQNVKAVAEYSKADETLVSYSFDDAENPAVTVGSKATAAYGVTTTGENEESIFTPYVSPINGGGFLNVWGANDTNGESTFEITSEDITSNGQWTLEFDWAGYSGCNKKAGATKLYDANGNAIFSIADVADWNKTMDLSFGGTIDVYPCNKNTRISAKTGTVLTTEYWHHFTVIGTVNGISVTIEKYAVDEAGAVTKTVVVKNAKAATSNATPAKIGVKPGSCGSVAIDNLTLTVGDLKIVEYAYTVKFVTEDGTEFKTAETRTDVEGAVLAATDEDKATITEGKTQYIYLSDDANEQALEGEGQVITITYQKLSVANYVVNYVDASGNTLKDATTHANVKVGTKVGATAGEMAQILVGNTLYNYVSGADSLTIAEDETANAINLVFAPVEGIEAYYLQNYEAATEVDWKTSVGGRFDPIIINGNVVANRDVQYTHVDTIATPVVDEAGEPVLDEEGNPTYTYTYNTVVDSTATIVFANRSKFLTVDQSSRNNNGATLTNSAISVEESNFTLEAKILLGSSNDQAGTTLTLFNKAGDAAILKLVQNGKSATSWKINDDAEKLLELPNSGTATGSSNDNLNNLSWYDFKVTVYNGLTFLTVTNEEGTAIFDKKQITTLATTYGLGKMTFASSRYNADFAIDDVLVRNVIAGEDVPGDMEFAEVQINYVDAEGNVLKAAETAKFSIGAAIELNSAFTADFKVDAEGAVWTAESETAPVTKYIYVSDNSAETVAAEGASVNIVYRGVASRRIALRPQIQLADGTMSTKDASGANIPFFYDSNKAGDVLFEGDVLTYYYPYYLLVNGLLYKTGANSGNEDHGTLEIEAGTGTQIKSPITWVAATKSVQSVDEEGNPMVDEEGNPVMEDVQIDNVVYAEESENIEGMTVVKDAYTTIRMANGAAGSAIGGNVLVTTLEPGVYTITSATRSGTTNFLVNDEIVFTIASTGTVQTATSAEITLDKETPIYIAEQSATTQYSDYVMITKVGDVTGPVVEINNIALSVDPVFNEEDEIVAAFTYEVVINDTELAEQYYVLSPTVYYTVYDGENEVYSKSCDFDISGDARNLFLTDLEPNKEYKVVINKIVVEDYSNVDWETVFDAEIVLEEEGELATATFTTEEPLPTELANADFSESTPTAVGVHTYEKDIVKDEEGNALDVAQAQEVEGWTISENGDARAAAVYAYGSEAYLGGEGYNAPATNPEGAAEGNALGLVGVWTGKIQYTQTIQLPAGEYMLEVPVYNAGGASAFATNLIGVNDIYATATTYPVGKWTTEQVKFTLAEEGPVTVSLGYVAANSGSAAMPHLFIDQVKILGEAEIAAAELAAAKANALANLAELPLGDGLFYYNAEAVETAKASIESAESIDDVTSAYNSVMLNARNNPVADQAYSIVNVNAAPFGLAISTEMISVAQQSKIYFTAVENEDAPTFVLSNENGEYIFKTTNNGWTLSTTNNIDEAYKVRINIVNGGYTIQGANGLFGTDAITADAAVYADKNADKNGVWTITDYAYLSVDDIALATDATFGDAEEEHEVTVVVTYVPTIEGYDEIDPDAVFHFTVKKGEEVIAEGEKNPKRFRDGTLNIFVSNLDYATEYTITIDKVTVMTYGFDENTYEMFTKVLFEAEGELATTTFTTPLATAITSLSTDNAEIEAVYTIGGAQLQGLQKGMNIVKYADGSVKKVFVK